VTVYCVHPIGGHVFSYLKLARVLESKATFMGLRAVGIEGECAPLASIEAIARSQVEALERSGDPSPRVLCGWSFGGVVALEMARQLVARGRPPCAVAMIDSRVPPDGDRAAIDDDRIERLFLENRARSEQGGKAASNAEVKPEERAVFRANLLALQQHTPAPYAGPVALLLTAASLEAGVDRPWRTLLGSLDVRRVPGDHHSLLRPPDVDVVAGHLLEVLQRLHS